MGATQGVHPFGLGRKELIAVGELGLGQVGSQAIIRTLCTSMIAALLAATAVPPAIETDARLQRFTPIWYHGWKLLGFLYEGVNSLEATLAEALRGDPETVTAMHRALTPAFASIRASQAGLPQPEGEETNVRIGDLIGVLRHQLHS